VTSLPLISVVITTKNRLATLGRAIDSVLRQTHDHFEIIVVDDASSDGTPAYLEERRHVDPRIAVIANATSVGGGQARNVGFTRATGAYVAFLDDDDEWVESKLAEQLAAIVAFPGAVAATCWYYIEFEGGGRRLVSPRAVSTARAILTHNSLGGASMCFCRADVLRKIGGFDPNLRSCQDWDLWVRLAEQGPIVVAERILVRYFMAPGERITTNVVSVYSGHRRFYFLHKAKMDAVGRRESLALLVHIRFRRYPSLRRILWSLVHVWRAMPFQRKTLALTKISVRLLVKGQPR